MSAAFSFNPPRLTPFPQPDAEPVDRNLKAETQAEAAKQELQVRLQNETAP